MAINLSGYSFFSQEKGNEIDTYSFVQKFFKRTIYIESSIEEDINMKNQFRIKNLPDPIIIRETTSKYHVDNILNDPTITKNTANVDFNDKNLDKIRFRKLIGYPAIGEHATANK